MPRNGEKVVAPPIEVELAGIVTWVRGSPLKCPPPASAFALAAKLTVARELQPEKALPPMELTDEGIVTETREMQPWKASAPMEVTARVLLPRSGSCSFEKHTVQWRSQTRVLIPRPGRCSH